MKLKMRLRFRNAVAVVLFAALAMMASAQKSTKQQKHQAHPCCYCVCQVTDYHRDCQKLCKLPKLPGDEDKDGKVRMFTSTENKMCQHLCAFKKEGAEHLKH